MTPVRDLFVAMTAYYGAQKVGAMWIGTDKEVVIGTWAEHLDRFSLEALEGACHDALHRLDDSGQREKWPPTLPEFLDLVEARQRAIQQAKIRHIAPPPVPDLLSVEESRVRLSRIREQLAQWKRP